MNKGLPVYDAGNVLSGSWLHKHESRLRIEDPGEFPFALFWICDYIRRQFPDTMPLRDRNKYLMDKLPDCKKTTVYRWNSKKWDFLEVYGRKAQIFINKLPTEGTKEFRIWIERTDGTKWAETWSTFNRLKTGGNIGEPEIERTIISHDNVKKLRENYLEAIPNDRIEIQDIDHQDLIIVNICNDYATGLMTIDEACKRQGMPVVQFMEVISTDEHASKSFNQASQVNKDLNTGRQINALDTIILRQLGKGFEESWKTKKRKVIKPNLKSEWVELEMLHTKKDFNMGQILAMRIALMRDWTLSGHMNVNEFSKMSQKDLEAYVMKHLPDPMSKEREKKKKQEKK